MIVHPPISVLFIVKDEALFLSPLLTYLRSMSHMSLSVKPKLPPDMSKYNVIVTADTDIFNDSHISLNEFIEGGGGLLLLNHLSERPLPPIVGAQPTPVGPLSELRVMFKNSSNPMAVRLPDAVYLNGRYQSLEIMTEDTETVLYADWHYKHSPVLVKRPLGAGSIACTTIQAYGHKIFQQILYRIIREQAGLESLNDSLGVGIIGYSPFVGKEHGMGIEATEGLSLNAFCDVSPDRLNEARVDFPGMKTYDSAGPFAKDADIDLVIICTPPNTHAKLSMEMMDAGKHVLCEKPLALSKKDVNAMVEMSKRLNLHLSCHQNRRWDSDYVAIRQSVDEGLIGELFYMETFVGGFSHPCGYWHSHEGVSGGAAYDWGGHYLDWVVSLIPDHVESVIGTRHKRVWHDVTNADQERIQVRFTGGKEAEFIHSDISAVRKPKWYLLGTKGAIVGLWKDVTQYDLDPVLYYHEHQIPPTEMLPDLTLHRRHASGQIVEQKLTIPERQHYLLYRNIADHLITGEPIAAPLEQSATVVAILEAAKRSATNGGSVEPLDV